MMIKVLSVFGTRPEAVKMAPLIKELEKSNEFESYVCVSGQHREMLDQVMDFFNIKSDYDFDIMKKNQTLSYISCVIFEHLPQVLKDVSPHIVLVHGDTTTSLIAALCAFYMQIPVGHVEAGLRTHDMYSPFPEEINRTLTGKLATLHFAPTLQSARNLRKENTKQNIFVVGNTAIDVFKYTIQKKYNFQQSEINNIIASNKKIILLTAHRRENLGENLENICHAMIKLAANHSDIEIIYPVHKNPKILDTTAKLLHGKQRITLVAPLSIIDMHNLIARSYMVLTDSGGLQEESSALRIPLLVLRTETERPEVIQCGGGILVGVDEDNIYNIASDVLMDNTLYTNMKFAKNPYGTGNVSKKILNVLRKWHATNPNN